MTFEYNRDDLNIAFLLNAIVRQKSDFRFLKTKTLIYKHVTEQVKK